MPLVKKDGHKSGIISSSVPKYEIESHGLFCNLARNVSLHRTDCTSTTCWWRTALLHVATWCRIVSRFVCWREVSLAGMEHMLIGGTVIMVDVCGNTKRVSKHIQPETFRNMPHQHVAKSGTLSPFSHFLQKRTWCVWNLLLLPFLIESSTSIFHYSHQHHHERPYNCQYSFGTHFVSSWMRILWKWSLGQLVQQMLGRTANQKQHVCLFFCNHYLPRNTWSITASISSQARGLSCILPQKTKQARTRAACDNFWNSVSSRTPQKETKEKDWLQGHAFEYDPGTTQGSRQGGETVASRVRRWGVFQDWQDIRQTYILNLGFLFENV